MRRSKWWAWAALIGAIACVLALGAVALAALTASEVTAPPVQIGGVRPENPAVSGARVVWADRRDGTFDIFLYDGVTGLTSKLVGTPADETQPSISGDEVVYVTNQNGTSDIYAYNILTGLSRPLCTDSGDQVAPDISGTRVVWEDHASEGNPDIIAYDLVTFAKVTIAEGASAPKKRPHIAGSLVVWEDYSGKEHLTGFSGRPDPDVRGYDFASGTYIEVARTTTSEMLPATDGRYIAWAQDAEGGLDIYALDTQTGLTYAVRRQIGEQTMPTVADGVVYWIDNTGGDRLHIDSFDLSTGRPAAFDDRGTGNLSGVRAAGGSVTWLERGRSRWEVRAVLGGAPSAVSLRPLSAWDAFDLRASLPADRQAPKVVETSVKPGQTSVTDGTFTFTFSEPLDPASVAAAARLTDADGKAVQAAARYAALGNAVVIEPVAQLAEGTYMVSLAPSVRDAAGNPIGEVDGVAFSTGVTIAAIQPTAPRLNAATVTGTDSVTISWRASSDAGGDLVGYQVFRSLTATGAATQIATVTAPTVSLVVSATPGERAAKFTYYYSVRAYDATFIYSNSSALMAPDPHGTFTGGANTISCGRCHNVHGSSGSGGALGAQSAASCYECHGDTPATTSYGVASSLDVQGNFRDDSQIATTGPFYAASRYVHRNAFMYNIQHECDACHTPHRKPYSTNPALSYNKLLRTQITTTTITYRYNTETTPTGDAFCFDCHGAASDNAATLIELVGGPTAYDGANRDHRTGWSTNDHSLIAPPSASPGIDCVVCHDQHGGTTASRLLGAFNTTTGAWEISGTVIATNNNTVCYACHVNPTAGFLSPSRTASGYPVQGTWPGRTAYFATYNATNHTGSIHGTSVAGVQWPSFPAGETRWGTPASGDCKNCHDIHGDSGRYDLLRIASGETSLTNYGPDTFRFCFECHDGSPSTKNVEQYYPAAVGGTSTDPRAGHRTVSGGNLPGGSALPCYDCHNPHGSGSAYGLLTVTQVSSGATIVVGDVAGEIDITGTPTAAAVREYCFTCHTTGDAANISGWNGSAYASVTAGAKVEGIDRTVQMAVGSSTGPHLRLPAVSGHYYADTQSCYTCHQQPHQPTGGISDGGAPCYGCHTSYKDPMEDSLGSKTGATRANFYHHVLGSATYDGDVAPMAGAYPTSTADVFCVSCHTDHNYFNSNPGANLRASITSTNGAEATNTDFGQMLVMSSQNSDVTTYAIGTTSLSGPWTNTTNANGAPNGTVAVSSANNAFEATQSFTGWPTDWTSISAASITVRSQALRNGWGGSWTQVGSSDKYAWVPYADGDVGGTWTGTYTTVDEYPTANTGDRLVDSTNANSQYYLFPKVSVVPSSVPANATNIQVGVGLGYRQNVTTADYADSLAARLKVGGAYYNFPTNINPGTAYAASTQTFTVNPRTGSAWTPDDVNGVGTNALQQYGVVTTTTASSATRVTMVNLVISYQIPGGTLTNDDTWQIDYSTNGGGAWSPIQAATNTSESALTSHTLDLTSILTTTNASQFRVRIKGTVVGSADNSGTVEWDASTLTYTWSKGGAAPTGYGICLSCHTVARDKQGMGGDQLAGDSAKTPAIDGAEFAVSEHNYSTLTTFGTSPFRANCSKCHSDEQTKEFQLSKPSGFGTHYSPTQGILAALIGTYPSGKCLDCHDAGGDRYGTMMLAAAKSVNASFTATSHHPVNGGGVECANCHNVHAATQATPAADPVNTYLPASFNTTDTQITFCTRCHYGSVPATQTNDTTLVPYPITVTAAGNKSTYGARGHWSASGSISAAERQSCAECHDKHGSSLPKLIPTTINGRTVTGNNNTVCYGCHTNRSATDSWDASGYPQSGPWSGAATYTASVHNANGKLCIDCHDVHGAANRFDETTDTFDPGAPLSYELCFNCHKAGGGASDIASAYPDVSGGSAGNIQLPPVTRYGHRTATDGNLPQYSALPCYDCHNPHGSASTNYALEVHTTTNTAIGTITVSFAYNTVPTAIQARRFCLACHTTSDLGQGWDGVTTVTVSDANARVEGISRTSALAVLHLPALGAHQSASTQSCYACHLQPHNPGGGISNGGVSCYGCHTEYQSPMEDGLGSVTGATRASTFHHVLGSSTPTEGDYAPGATSTYPSSTTDVFCVSCHTDHNYFNANKGANLRQGGGTAGTPATDTDFIGTGSPSYGVCVNCHKTSLAKQGLGADQASSPQTRTPRVVGATYTASAHDYSAPATFGASRFNANCSKCHTDEQAKSYQVAPNRFGTHWSAVESIIAALTGVGQPSSACLDCHSTGGDKYGVAAMSSVSTAVGAVFTGTSHHPINGGGVECASCHNVHAASNVATVADPRNTYAVYSYNTTTTKMNFCLICHYGSVPTTATNDTTLVPYPVTVTAAGNKSTYGARGHWNASGSISVAETQTCSVCHDQHGSTLPKMLLTSINGKSVTGNDKTVCYACHSDKSTGFPAKTAPSMSASWYPLDGSWPGSPTATGYNGSAHDNAASVTCVSCHDVHGTANVLDELVATFTAGNFSLCFECHKPAGASTHDIQSLYPPTAGGTSSDSRAGHKTISSTSTVFPAGSALPCYMCHNPHGSAEPTFGLLVNTTTSTAVGTLTAGDAAGEIDVGTAAGVRKFCFLCHTTADGPSAFDGSKMTSLSGGPKVAGTSRVDQSSVGATTGPHLRLPNVNGHYYADPDNCLGCHGDPHQPTGGLSNGGTPCYGCHKFKDDMDSTGANKTSSYHHVLGTGAGDLGDRAPKDLGYPTSKQDVYCVSCHTDHNYFNPPTGTKANNLRRSIDQSGSVNTTGDFMIASPWGVCVSCHSVSLTKDNTNQKAETSTSKTPTITGSEYDTSAHQYTTASAFGTFGNFYGDCGKCHEDGQTYASPKQTSTLTFGVHWSAARRILAALGGTINDIEENACYRCHSHQADAVGGVKKPVDGRDWYNAAAMSSKAESFYAIFSTLTYKHNVAGYSNKHLPSSVDETLGYISANKHVGCLDCHNVHAAKAGVHTTGTNVVSPAVVGVSGAKVTTASGTNWHTAIYDTQSNYTLVTTSSFEYQICLKCHSGANSSLTSWDSTWTNVALEFNTSNQSYHPVFGPLPAADPGVNGSSRLEAVQLVGWKPGDVMTCSDCHGPNNGSANAQGPHGSAVRWMLKGPRTGWSTSSIMGGEANIFCMNCHAYENPTNVHDTGRHNYPCMRCHIRVPHGGKVSRLIGDGNGTMPARYNGGMWVNNFIKNTPAGYAEPSCNANASCNYSAHSASTGENW